MKTAKTFQSLIQKIAAKYGLDLKTPHKYIKIENKPYMPLTIEVIGKNRVAVSHTFIQNGDLMRDPEVVFFTGYDEWVPVSFGQPQTVVTCGNITRVLGGYKEYAKISDDATRITHLNRYWQADLASFCRTWGANIRAQGFLTHGVLVENNLNPDPAPVAAQVEKPKEQKTGNGAKRALAFRKAAATLEKQIEDKRRPRQANTHRRARMAASAEADARYLELVQDKLRALADAYENKVVPILLAGISTKAQVEFLLQEYCYFPQKATPERNRLTDAGIYNQDMLEQVRAAIRALGNAQAGEKTEADKLRELIRQVGLMKIESYFPTPEAIIARMLQIAEIGAEDKVLEPSAGAGHIADAIKKCNPAGLHVIEIVPKLREILTLKGYSLMACDFLTVKTSGYTKIVMNPPFEKMQDVDHVRHAYSLLLPGGRLVAIMSESPFFRQDEKAKQFRAWFDLVRGKSDKLPNGAFMDSDRPTGIAARIVWIDKPAADEVAGELWREQRQQEADIRGMGYAA